MTARYERFLSPRDVLTRAAELSARTYIVDVEPLVATWHSGPQPLDEGVARTVGQLGAIAEVRVVCFATNSARHPGAIPSSSAAQVMYLASARKPLATALYRDLPLPGVVIGDQVVTDGVLARRLGFTFLHYCPEVSSVPVGPRLLRYCGWLLLPLLYPGHSRRTVPRRGSSSSVAESCGLTSADGDEHGDRAAGHGFAGGDSNAAHSNDGQGDGVG